MVESGLRGDRWKKSRRISKICFDSLECLLTQPLPFFILPQQLEYGFKNLCKPCDELAQILDSEKKAPNIFLGHWWRHFYDCLHFTRINLNPSPTNDKS